jgi:hypothetical protein
MHVERDAALSRRALLGVAAAASFPVLPVLADQDLTITAADYMRGKRGGVAGKVKVAGSGLQSTKLLLSGPASPTLQKEFVDLIWFTGDGGQVLAVQKFKENGKSTKEAATADTKSIEPSLQGRFNKGTTVVPFIHTTEGGTWEGAPITI